MLNIVQSRKRGVDENNYSIKITPRYGLRPRGLEKCGIGQYEDAYHADVASLVGIVEYTKGILSWVRIRSTQTG